jgi:hypothetical protein
MEIAEIEADVVQKEDFGCFGRKLSKLRKNTRSYNFRQPRHFSVRGSPASRAGVSVSVQLGAITKASQITIGYFLCTLVGTDAFGWVVVG